MALSWDTRALTIPVTLDARGRAKDHLAAAQPNLPLLHNPALIFFDFCAAFPSVAHVLIFLTLEAIGIPLGLVNYFRALYHSNRCFGCLSGNAIFLYEILSGIIHGCPASGTIFLIVVDPFLRCLKRSLEDTTARAFAAEAPRHGPVAELVRQHRPGKDGLFFFVGSNSEASPMGKLEHALFCDRISAS